MFKVLMDLMPTIMVSGNVVWDAFLDYINDNPELSKKMKGVPDDQRDHELKMLYMGYGPPRVKYIHTYKCCECDDLHTLGINCVVLSYQHSTLSKAEEKQLENVANRNIVQQVVRGVLLATVHETNSDLVLQVLPSIDLAFIVPDLEGDHSTALNMAFLEMSTIDPFVSDNNSQEKQIEEGIIIPKHLH